MAPIKAKEYVTLGFSYKITKGLSEPGGREYTCPPPPKKKKKKKMSELLTLYAPAQPEGQIMSNSLLHAPPHPLHMDFQTFLGPFVRYYTALLILLHYLHYKEANTYTTVNIQSKYRVAVFWHHLVSAWSWSRL